jgi:threonine synthase
VLDVARPGPLRPQDVDISETGFWRYAAALGLRGSRVRLGESVTPLVASAALGPPCLLKVDYLLPTGSYKDRGAAFMVSSLLDAGVDEVLDDSSGNAGAALAAYAASAGIGCTVFTPSANTTGKLAQIQSYGARLVRVDGSRVRAAHAARDAAARMFYASHNHLPAFLQGISTLGLEIWEQSGFALPEHVVAPCGYGSVVLGLQHAFDAITTANPSLSFPRIHAVQSDRYPAVTRAWAARRDAVLSAGGGITLAEGIACRQPVRGAAVLAAISDSGGTACTVGDDDIVAALRLLTSVGLYPEPTGAVAAAGYRRLIAEGVVGPGESCVVVLTGSGLKAGSAIADLIGRAGY